MTIRPFTPHEAVEAGRRLAITQIPDYVVAAVNNLLTKAFAIPNQPKSVNIYQDKLISEILRLAPSHGVHGLTQTQIFDQHLLDIEVLFREQGWNVIYDRPGYGESYEAFFKFTMP